MQTPASDRSPDHYIVRLSGPLAALLGRAQGAELPEDDLLGWLRAAALITYPSPLLGGLLEKLPEVLAVEVLSQLESTDFAICGRVGSETGGGSGLRPAARGGDRGDAVPDQPVCRVRRAAGLTQGERLPVGGDGLCTGR